MEDKSGYLHEEWLFFENLIVSSATEEFPNIYGTQSFITAFIKSRQWSIS
jgi:hypothetical protein